MPDVTSGWGRLTWDQANWGDAVTLKTGWGAQAWDGEGGWGDLSDQTITLDGQSATTSVGSTSLEINFSGELSGQEATSSVGSLSVQVDFTGTLTGQEATSSVNSLVTEVAYELSGQSTTTNVGSINYETAYVISIGSALSDNMRANYGDVDIALEEVVVPKAVVASCPDKPTESAGDIDPTLAVAAIPTKPIT